MSFPIVVLHVFSEQTKNTFSLFSSKPKKENKKKKGKKKKERRESTWRPMPVRDTGLEDVSDEDDEEEGEIR